MSSSYLRKHFQHKETIVTILACDSKYILEGERSILNVRSEIERFISIDPLFEVTLEPYIPVHKSFIKSGSHYFSKEFPAVSAMINAGTDVGTGPMSAVAGVISEYAINSMKKAGAKFAVVDNGGDIVLYNSPKSEIDSFVVGIYANESLFSNYGFLLKQSESNLSICTSSGTVGHSISFGISDAAIVFSSDAAISDAAATELGNLLREPGAENIKQALNSIIKIDRVKGAVLIKDNEFGTVGQIPEIVSVNMKPDIITKG